jgi:hypothetical protein
MASIVFDEKSAVSYLFFLYSKMFFIQYFQKLSLVSTCLTIVDLDVDFIRFMQFGVCPVS